MSIRRTVYIVSIDAFKENKSYAFSSSVDTFEDYKNAQCRLHEVLREWKLAIQNSSTCKEKEFIDKYGWDNIYANIYEIIPSGECTHLDKNKVFSADDVYFIHGTFGYNLGYGMNTRVSYSLTKDGTLHLFGERMKDFDNLEDRPWHNFSQYIRRIELIVERIGNHAFEGCKSLVEVTIKGHGPEIGDSAFENCASLTHFSGPTILRSIGKRAFYNCVALKDSIDAYTIDDYAFFNCKSMKVYNCVRKASIIGKHAFEKCNSINREGLNWANESVCDYAYANCSQLTSFSFGPDTLQIGNIIFYGCSNLKKVSIPRKFNDSIFQIIGFTGIEIDYF